VFRVQQLLLAEPSISKQAQLACLAVEWCLPPNLHRGRIAIRCPMCSLSANVTDVELPMYTSAIGRSQHNNYAAGTYDLTGCRCR